MPDPLTLFSVQQRSRGLVGIEILRRLENFS